VWKFIDACHNRKVVDDLVKAMPAKEQQNRTKAAMISNAVRFLNETAKTNDELENLVSEVCSSRQFVHNCGILQV
jgi:hypothetical protein